MMSRKNTKTRSLKIDRRTAGAVLAATCLLAAVVLTAADAEAQGSIRAWGMGGAQTAGARGLAAVEYNPANLSLSNGTNVGLAGVAVDVNNNALTLDRYNEITGSYLDESDKQQLLDDIPDSGFRLDADIRASAIGAQVGDYALSVEAWGAGSGNLDRDYFDLVLFGNELDETIDFSNTHGEGWAVASAAVSASRQLVQGGGWDLYGGMNARYFQGIYEMHVEEAYGTLTTTMDEIRGEAYVQTLSAKGGQGAGCDLGLALQLADSWTLGLALDNAYSRIDWNTDVETQRYWIDAADINLANDDLDDAVADADTTLYGGSYTTTLPRVLRLGAANKLGAFHVAVDYVQGFETRGTTSTTPQMNAGAEWDLCGWLKPRAGMSVGGAQDRALAGGLGLGLGPWKIDLAAMTRGGLSGGGTKGVGFAAGTSLQF